MNNGSAMSPVKTATVSVGGLTHELKLSFYSEVMLDEYGIDMAKLFVTLATRPGNVSAYLKCLSALTAHTYVDNGLNIPSLLDWQKTLEASPTKKEDFSSIIAGVREVMFVKKSKPVAEEAGELLASPVQ